MQTNIIPNIYEAARSGNIESSVGVIFPTSNTRTLTQIAYYLKRQAQLGEQVVERAREQRFIELSQQDILFGITLKKRGQTVTRYKFVVPNQIGFPVIGISSDVRSINLPISQALGVGNYTARNGMREIQAWEIPLLFSNANKQTNIITRNDRLGFPVKIYITKFEYKI